MFATCVMSVQAPSIGSTPFFINWQPDQDEQRKYERERSASCVIVRWEGGSGFADRSEEPILYIVEECAYRIGRSLTKREKRGLLRQIDPQMRQAREQFAARGWRLASDAPLRLHAKWLARHLLSESSWMKIADEFGADAQRGLDDRVVRRACLAFARASVLALHPREAAA